MRYNTKRLKEVVGRVSKAVEDNAELDTFKEMKFSFYDGTTTISAYMPGFSIEEAFGTEGAAMPTIGLGGKKLKAIIEHLPGEECDISFDGTKTVIKAGRSRYTLPVARDQDFLEFSWPQCLDLNTISKREFLLALKRCSAAAEKENEDRPERAVVHFSERHVVSSDGYVMACQESPLVVPEPFNLSMNHAGRLLRVLEGSCANDVSYAFKHGTLHIMAGRLAILVTGVAAMFPNYENVLRSHQPSACFMANRRGLLEEVQRLSAVSDKNERAATMTLESKGLTLYGVFGGSEVETFMECDIVLPEGKATIGFMVNHLLRGLKTLSADEVSVEVVSPSRPVCFREASYGCFIVPRRY